MQMRTNEVQSWACVLIYGLAIGSLAGCGGAPPAPKRQYADVVGKVSYKGEPLKMGQVMFQPTIGAVTIGDIKGDGTYSFKGVIGPNTVTIVSEDKSGPMSADDPKSRQPPKSHIPAKYNTTNSGLKFDVKAGKNTADFELKD